MYLTNNLHLDIVFSISFLVRYSSCLTKRYWNEIKHIHHFQGTSDMELFYSYDRFGSKQIGNAYA